MGRRAAAMPIFPVPHHPPASKSVSNRQPPPSTVTHAEGTDFSEVRRALRRRVDEALDAYTRYGPDCPGELAAAIRHSLLAPAKRLRPLLVVMDCEASGCDPTSAVGAARAVEMVDAYLLLHADL